MNWKETSLDKMQIYPVNSITVFMMDTQNGKTETHWVDKAYKNYKFKKECKFNCYITVDFTDDFNAQQDQLDITDIEKYLTTNLREVCVCHLVARITTDVGINLEFYVDEVEEAIKRLNELEEDTDRLINFDCEITEDEEWENVFEILN
ncbi:DUF695 domain-containing protein [Flavobacterium sp. NKUCC04_CG]|nr:DUF695 domain-containing protein [Flavobacterium sp. NKUCC04_CG]